MNPTLSLSDKYCCDIWTMNLSPAHNTKITSVVTTAVQLTWRQSL